MKVNSISSYNYSNKQNQNMAQKPSFGHKIIIDIGASNKKGSLKLLALTDKGKQIFKQKGFVNDTIEGFKGGADFIDKLRNIIANAQSDIMKMSKAGQLKLRGKDKLLTGLAIFVPGTTVTKDGHDKIAFMPNLRDREGQSLENIDFTEFEEALKTGSIDARGIRASKDMKLSVTKDLGGCGMAIAESYARNNKLNEGDYIMGIMTGGGFGSVDIKVKNGNVEIETSESSNYLSGNFGAYSHIANEMTKIATSKNPKKELEKLTADNNKELQDRITVIDKIGRQGVCVKSHIKTYFDALNLHELGKIALKSGDARIVEENSMVLNKKNDEHVIKEIREHKEFIEIPSGSPDKIKFMLDESKLPEGAMRNARKEAVDSYANSASLITINKINDFLTKVVIAGPFAHGVDDYVRNHPEDFEGAKNLPELIMQKIKRNISKEHADLPSTEKLLKLYNLQIEMFDEKGFEDNTYSGDVLLNKKTSFVQNRGGWFSIKLEDLKKIADKKAKVASKK